MNVLSLFDGMSCGMIALDRLGIKVDNYYASEIDKYAMQVSAANYPEIIQVGDITKLDLSTLPKIDLVMGGSPCQGFSFAGKQLAFDDPRSALFFEFVKCVEALKPKYFLLENVKMKKEYLDIISEYMGVEPIFIQSSLVSAQSRQRYYWTNIPNVTPPEERGIVLRDILEDQVGSEHYVGDNMQKNYNGGNQLNPNYKSQANTIHNEDKKSGTICAGTHGYANGYVGDKHKPVKHTERNARHLKQLDEKSLCMTATMYKGAGNNGMTLVPQKILDNNLDKMTTKDGKAYALTTTYGAAGAKDSLEKKRRSMIPTSDKPQHIGTAVDINGHDILKRVYSPDGKSPTVTACSGGNNEPKVVAGAWRGRYNEDGSTSQKLELTRDSKANAITTVQKDSVVTFSDKRIEKFKETLKENPQPSKNGIIQLNNPSHSSGRVYSPDGKSPTLMAGNSGGGKEPVKINDDMYWRKLTPLECERLQTVPDNYTNHVSNTQRYKMLGNGWTIEVIAHIFKNMEVTS
jgi:DNA-cytosine methyltransferase